ncbi:Taurine transport system permease protein TauC [Hartmannibacter diazotrophicus]|uniref:Taurine transport system permease protein TauC n=1 Tax=Hartmannibacter diazotrophicus TaxID=1482074 RepID=A0A2C9DAC3_9HYPH|nr:ABC transporter permease [Hartmannibacter diazotrophicus]SON56691.1 Taurine transport system permease protein TauC [Hartmannibacter diazotrophicus]
MADVNMESSRAWGGGVVGTTIRYLPIALLFVAWEMIHLMGLVPEKMLPGVGEIIGAFVKMLTEGDLLWNTFRSLSRAAVGLGAAVAIGILIGILMASSRIARLLLNPIVQIFYPMPRSALIPVVMIWLGLGDSSKILLIFLGCLLPVIIATYNGARGVNPVLLWSASSLGASRLDVMREVLLPAAMPEIVNGCRTALAFAFILMVSSEFIIATDGIGFMISQLGDAGYYPGMFAAIFFVSGVGFAFDRLYAAFARRILRWRDA